MIFRNFYLLMIAICSIANNFTHACCNSSIQSEYNNCFFERTKREFIISMCDNFLLEEESFDTLIDRVFFLACESTISKRIKNILNNHYDIIINSNESNFRRARRLIKMKALLIRYLPAIAIKIVEKTNNNYESLEMYTENILVDVVSLLEDEKQKNEECEEINQELQNYTELLFDEIYQSKKNEQELIKKIDAMKINEQELKHEFEKKNKKIIEDKDKAEKQKLDIISDLEKQLKEIMELNKRLEESLNECFFQKLEANAPVYVG